MGSQVVVELPAEWKGSGLYRGCGCGVVRRLLGESGRQASNRRFRYREGGRLRSSRRGPSEIP